MEKRLTEKRRGGGIKKEREDPNTERSGWESGKLQENRPILYFSISSDRTSIVTGSYKKYHSKPIIRLASCLPSWQAFLSFLRGWENSYQKTGTFFGVSGSRSIRKQIIFSLTIPPPPEETDRINLSLTCISSGAIHFFWFLRPTPYRITKNRSDEGFLVKPKYEAATGWWYDWRKKELGGIKREREDGDTERRGWGSGKILEKLVRVKNYFQQ